MNKFTKMLMQDSKNPYGSRGGYYRDMTEDYARRNMRRDYENDYARRDRNDYANYYDEHYYGYPMGERYHDYGYDYRMRDRRDYGEPEMFSHRDIDKWKMSMKNEDGTTGEHFRKEQVKHACEQTGIDCEKFGNDVFELAMNMMYSDYCNVAKKYGVDRPEFYADMTKAFLQDKDFDGTPEEKLYLYYKAIAEKDD